MLPKGRHTERDLPRHRESTLKMHSVIPTVSDGAFNASSLSLVSLWSHGRPKGQNPEGPM